MIAARAQIERRAASGWQWAADGPLTSERGQLDRELPRQFAFALADFLWCTERERPSIHVGTGRSQHAAELLAAMCRALELAGCDTYEVGEVSAPCLAVGIEHANASGGIWIGNASGREHELCLLTMGRAGLPWSLPGTLSEFKSRLASGAVRPRRSGGSLRRFNAAASYLPLFRETFHGLRALEFVLHTSNSSLLEYLKSLRRETALRIHLLDKSRPHATVDVAADSLEAECLAVAREVVLCGSHFGLWIDGAGQRCELVDEGGRKVPHDRLAQLLNIALASGASEPSFEQLAPPEVAREQIGSRMLSERTAAVRADGRGNYWFPGHASPDALAALCVLLSLLSRSDRPLSEVLDGEESAL
jgi:phosphomannomutase